jgi:hypothetical protein
MRLFVAESDDKEFGDVHKGCPRGVGIRNVGVQTPDVLEVNVDCLIACPFQQHVDKPFVRGDNLLQLALYSLEQLLALVLCNDFLRGVSYYPSNSLLCFLEKHYQLLQFRIFVYRAKSFLVKTAIGDCSLE